MLQSNLQLVLGNDKSQTDLTVYKTENGEFLHVYLGVALLEVIPNNKKDFFFRFLVARLYSLGIACEQIARQLIISEKTIRRLAMALRSGDPAVIRRVFAGHSSKEKIGDEIKRYIEEKYWELKDRCRNFAKQILAKVNKYWKVTLSEEFLRKLFREADRKAQARQNEATFPGSEYKTDSVLDMSSSTAHETANNIPGLNQTVSINSSIKKKHHEKSNRELGWETWGSERKLLTEHIPELKSAHLNDIDNERVLPNTWSREDPCVMASLPKRSTANPRRISKSEFVNSNAQIPASICYSKPFNRVAEFPYSQSQAPDRKQFCHHLGLVLFMPWLERFSDSLEAYLPNAGYRDQLDLIRQFQAQVLLGALNHEQSLELSFSSLEFLVGPCFRSVDYQRIQLNRLLTQQCFKGIWRANAEVLGGFDKQIFYYDPHVKKYTGILQVLRGWCGSVGKITDALNLDFFHDHYGNPCFAEHFDCYYDQRERVFLCLHNFLEVFPELKSKELLFIFDRGLYSLELMLNLRKKNCHFITWDKDFDEKEFKPFHNRRKEFYHSNLRNHSDDFIFSHYTYYEEKWKRQPQFRQIVVHAVSHKAQSIKLAILCSEPSLDPQQIIVYIIRRWLQENDFAYMIRHSGINELTARSSQKYSADTPVADRMVQSKQYKKFQKKKKQIETRLKNLTFQHHCLERKTKNVKKHGYRFKEQKARIRHLEEEVNCNYKIYDDLCEKMKSTPKKQWRKKELQNEGISYFVTYKKAIMDSIRVSTRNIFYSAIAIFRPLFNNYRSDHKIIRNLLKTPGFVYKKHDCIHIQLLLRYHLEKKEKEKVHQFITNMSQKINAQFNGKYLPISIKISDDKDGPIFL